MPNLEKLEAAANVAWGLAMDAIAARASGHLGLPLGTVEIGAVLYGELLRQDPADPSVDQLFLITERGIPC
jgi:transketolase